MTVNRFIRNLLNLKELAVTHFELDVRHRILNLWVRDLEFNKSTNSPLITRYIDRPFFDPCYSGNHFF